MVKLIQFIKEIDWTKDCSENEKVVRIGNFTYNENIHPFLYAVKSELNSIALGTLSLETDIGPTEIDNTFSENFAGQVTIVIKKENPLYFISENGFIEYLSQNNHFIEKSPLRLFFIKIPFETMTYEFVPLSSKRITNEVLDTALDYEPIKYTRAIDNESSLILPKFAGQWITKEKYLDSCPQSWKIESTKRLLSTFALEISKKDDLVSLEFKGDRRKGIDINYSNKNNDCFNQLFNITHRIADWLFLQNRDYDVRLTLFNQQMIFLLLDEAREYSDLERILRSAFESTKTVYQYNLLNVSKEVQKNLSDLNKTLFDYVTKVRQGISDLTSSLWKDFALVLGLFILNFSSKTSEIIKGYFNYFAYGLCLYISINFILNSISTFWFYYGLKENLYLWRNKLYTYMTDSEFNNLAIQPLGKFYRQFRTVFFISLFFYIILLIAILFIANRA